MNILNNKNNIPKFFLILVVIGLLIRILFSFWASKFYFGEVKYTFGDSFSYTQAFINLVQSGTYSFDLKNPDAALYRGPTYPFFWGIHYLIFGEELAYRAVALSQSFIDTVSAILVFLITRLVSKSHRLATLGAALYLFNPIFLVHVPITGTETFATFLTLSTVLFAIKAKSKYHLFLVGSLCAAALMTRQYLGLLLPVTLLYIIASNNFRLKYDLLARCAMLIIGFLVVVSPWFLRNLINHETPSLLMGKTPGYESYQADYTAFHRFYTLYFVDITPIFNRVSTEGRDGVEEDVRLANFKERLDNAARVARHCGPSFNSWRRMKTKTQDEIDYDCSVDIIKNYTDLRKEAIEQYGWQLLIKIPLENIRKAIFKSELTAPTTTWKDTVIQIIFSIRTLIVISGLAFMLMAVRTPFTAFLLFPISLILYISSITRQVEMRYLVQSDALLIVFAVLFIGTTYDKVKVFLRPN
jgi:hypothetical protein